MKRFLYFTLPYLWLLGLHAAQAGEQPLDFWLSFFSVLIRLFETQT